MVVEDNEVFLPAENRCFISQQTRPEGMERTYKWPLSLLPLAVQPLFHFPGCFIGERHGANSMGSNSFLY